MILCVHNSKRHDPGYVGASGWLRRHLLMPMLYRRADCVVAVSRDLRQELINYLGLPATLVQTINNFVEVDSVLERASATLLPAEAALFAHGPVLVVAGRISAEKNQIALLSVLARLRETSDLPVRLLLLGDGPSRPALVAAAAQFDLCVWDGAAQNGLPPSNPAKYDLILLGFRSNPFPYIAQATISIVPSLTEGFPMAICEALACGVPVASADCPTGPREILAPASPPSQYATHAEWAEYGLLLPLLNQVAVSAGSVAAWADGLLQLLHNSSLRTHYAAQAQRRAKAFGPSPVLARWEALIQSSSHCS